MTPNSSATISNATAIISSSHLDEGQKIYRAVGDCAPAFGMIGTLLGMVQMFANMTDPSKLGPFMATALAGDALRRGGGQHRLPADRR